jgi:hypothetical protein
MEGQSVPGFSHEKAQPRCAAPGARDHGSGLSLFTNSIGRRCPSCSRVAAPSNSLDDSPGLRIAMHSAREYDAGSSKRKRAASGRPICSRVRKLSICTGSGADAGKLRPRQSRRSIASEIAKSRRRFGYRQPGRPKTNTERPFLYGFSRF